MGRWARHWGPREGHTALGAATVLRPGGGFPVAQKVKNLSALQETWVLSLGQEDALEKGMTTCSSILVWRIPWTEEPGDLKCLE